MATISLVEVVILAIIIGTLGAIVYSLRLIFLIEKRIARMDENMMRLTKVLVKEEKKIESMIKK